MIAYQQGRIIRMKTRSEGLQKELLQNMLPPMIVEELQKKNYKVSSWSELRTLSKRHVGVSLLFAPSDSPTCPPRSILQRSWCF